MLSTRLLVVHRSVVEEGSLTRAAAVLGYTVSAVSQQLAAIEATLGAVLFDRAARPFALTPAGGLFRRHAQVFREGLSALPRVTQLPLGRQTLRLRGMDAHTLWLDFAALCQQPLASRDYLALCQRFPRLVISALPALAGCSLDEQQRLVNFIDIAYDHGSELWLQSEVPLEVLCAGVGHGDFPRTRSRLAQLRAETMERLAC